MKIIYNANDKVELANFRDQLRDTLRQAELLILHLPESSDALIKIGDLVAKQMTLIKRISVYHR